MLDKLLVIVHTTIHRVTVEGKKWNYTGEIAEMPDNTSYRLLVESLEEFRKKGWNNA